MHRSVDDCPYRERHPGAEGHDSHSCALVQKILGSSDPALAVVLPNECAACCRQREPQAAMPNAMVASLLYKALLAVERAGGVPGCDSARAGELKKFATQHLMMVGGVPPGQSRQSARGKAPPYTVPCRFLGKEAGEELCTTCKGRVMQKAFACHHPRHQKTTILKCRHCPDYEPGGDRQAVERWSVGILTAPRRKATLRRTVRSLREAGWDGLMLVFAEAGASGRWALRGLGPIEIVRRQAPALGAWPNFLLALTELVMRDPEADAYLLVQDDVVFCRGVRHYLGGKLWPGPVPGVVSLHTPRHLAPRSGTGFFSADLGWSAWGAQAFVFPNAAARALLSDARVAEHRLKGPLGGTKNVDSVVGEWCRRTKREFWLHAPSLCEHTGETSTLWPGTALEGRRVSADFPGESLKVADALRQRAALAGDQAPDSVIMLDDGTLAAVTPSQDTGNRTEKTVADFEEFWAGMELDILSITTGRAHAFDAWSEWLATSEVPPATSLILVDNAPLDARHAGDRLRALASALSVSARFQSVTVVKGRGPSTQARTSDDRVRNCAVHYGLGFARIGGRFVFVLDDDVIPPADALRHLAGAWNVFASQGRNPGLVSGCYESARTPGILVAGRDLTAWRDQPKVGEPGSGVVQQVGFVGLGCALVHVSALRRAGEFDLAAIHGNAGPDAWLCKQLGKRGFTIWLHGSVVCEHRHHEGGDGDEMG